MATRQTDEELCRILAGRSGTVGRALQLTPEAAFEELYSRHFLRITRLAERLLTSMQVCSFESDFVANGVMFKIFQAVRKENYDENCSFQPWANQITRNTVRDLARQTATRTTLEALPETTVASCEDPLFSVIATEEAKKIQKALDNLPEDERSMMQLHYLEGMSVPEIELHTGKSCGAVRGLLQRARARLRVMS